jgi:hypothetical protein
VNGDVLREKVNHTLRDLIMYLSLRMAERRRKSA